MSKLSSMQEDLYKIPDSENEPVSRDSASSDIRELYLQVYNPLFHYGCSIENNPQWVHDEIQELFIWLIQHPDKWQAIQEPRAYLFKSLRRNIRSKAKQSRKQVDQLEAWQNRKSWEEAPQEMALISQEGEAQLSQKLAEGMGKLSSHQREVIFLRFYQSMSYDEIASIFSVSNQVVRNAVFRAIKNLRTYISNPKNLGAISILASIFPSS